MYIKNKKGQSTVEYVLLVTAVIAVIIVMTTGNHAGGVQSQLNSIVDTASNEMSNMAGTLGGSYVQAPANATTPTVPTGGTVNVNAWNN